MRGYVGKFENGHKKVELISGQPLTLLRLQLGIGYFQDLVMVNVRVNVRFRVHKYLSLIRDVTQSRLYGRHTFLEVSASH